MDESRSEQKKGDGACAPSPFSQKTEVDLHATEANHAEEVLDVKLLADHQPTKVMDPSEKSLDSPTFAVTAQRTNVLRRGPAHSTMRCDHLKAVPVGRVTIQTVTVIGFVADQSRREGG